MPSPAKHSHDEALKPLLEEGARSYLDAVTALIAFQREVQKKCRKVMAKNLRGYESAMKVRMTSSEIGDCAWPSFGEWGGDWWSLGVKIARSDIPGVRWWETYCCLQYESRVVD